MRPSLENGLVARGQGCPAKTEVVPDALGLQGGRILGNMEFLGLALLVVQLVLRKNAIHEMCGDTS